MWFSASLLFRGDSDLRAPSEILWEDVIVLIDAPTEYDAAEKVPGLVSNWEIEYVSATGERIKWTFDSINEVCEIGNDLTHGTELFSRFLSAAEVEELKKPFD